MVESSNSKKSYENGRIYCIRNSVNNDIYVGSTTQPLSKRFQKHKETINNKRDGNMLIYQKMREIGKQHFYIELYEEYPCENIEQLRKREGEIIRELKPSLNKRIEDRTTKEYREDKKEKLQMWNKQYREERKEELKEYSKRYREENKEVLTEKKKEYYEHNKEHYKQYREENKDRIKDNWAKYYEENKEKLKERSRERGNNNKEQRSANFKKYYAENKEKIMAKKQEYQLVKITCECGMEILRQSKPRHLKSKHHQNYEQSLQKD